LPFFMATRGRSTGVAGKQNRVPIVCIGIVRSDSPARSVTHAMREG
jgi:hypothetical protein